MRILVTGGAGRLGVHICKTLVREGFQVRVFDLYNARNRKNVRTLADKDVEICWGDVTDRDSVNQALQNIDLVLHMAGILPPVAYQKPELARSVNVNGTRILVDALKENGGTVPLIYTSSAAVFGPTPDANEPICPDRHMPSPKDVYGQTKLEAESIIRQSGLEHVILRLTATMYLLFETSDLRRMFSIPLRNRIEYCHPDDTSRAIVSTVRNIHEIKGNTYVIAGGPGQRMLYGEMIAKILGVMGLPMPPASKFTRKPYYLDWYDTTAAQRVLEFQRKSFSDYLSDFQAELTRVYTPLFLPFMRYFVSPLFGRLVVRFF